MWTRPLLQVEVVLLCWWVMVLPSRVQIESLRRATLGNDLLLDGVIHLRHLGAGRGGGGLLLQGD